jgi:hypothetical protein
MKEILKTLSDTEITAIAYELADPSIDNQSIYNQLAGKSNGEKPSIEMISILPTLVAVELSDRLLNRNIQLGEEIAEDYTA